MNTIAQEKQIKKVYIINGAMGVIGSPVFTHLALQSDTVVYGISRRGLPFNEYLDEDNKLPEAHLVFSLGDYMEDGESIIETFVDSLPENYEIIFLHSMGCFLTEMNREGQVVIENDNDSDGINDTVKRLTYTIPRLFAEKLSQKGTRVSFLQLGSLADDQFLPVHHSWVTSMDMIKKEYKKISQFNSNFSATTINVSSVLTPKELIERPFVTLQTNADLKFWLDPADIGKYIYTNRDAFALGYTEISLFNSWPKFNNKHFHAATYIDRRKKEVFKS